MKAFVFNIDTCSGCYCCQIGCKDEHCGNDWSPFSKPQPDYGQFWLKIHEYERGNIPHVKKTYIPVICMHCKDAPCITSCPIEGALYQRPDGLVIIDPIKCTGCQNCIDACPYGVIYYNKNLNIAQKCAGCAHLLEKGWETTRCADNCAHDAISFGEESDISSLINKAEVWHPEYNLITRVSYIGLPKRFVAGTVYDPSTKEVVIGANCTLSGTAGDKSTTTDEFGDFWLDGLANGTFTLTINSNGKTKIITGDVSEKDIGLGDIALS